MRKMGYNLERLQRYLEDNPIGSKSRDTLRQLGFEAKVTQTFTIECPHCKRFFEFELEVKR